MHGHLFMRRCSRIPVKSPQGRELSLLEKETPTWVSFRELRLLSFPQKPAGMLRRFFYK